MSEAEKLLNVSPERSPSGGGGPTAAWSALGAMIGGAVGCVSAQMSLQSTDFEHGAPGIGIYLLYVAAGRTVLGAVLGLIVGGLIASFRAAPPKSEPSEDEGVPPTPDP